MILYVLAGLLVGPGAALFKEGESAVTILKESTFRETVLNSPKEWLVEFYAPWCGHCKSSANDVKQAANILEGIVNIGVVDATVETSLAGKYDVSGYPTLKYFKKGSHVPFESKDRTFEGFVDWCLTKMKVEVKRRLSAAKAGQ
jgi:protein disulfide-isomerase A6